MQESEVKTAGVPGQPARENREKWVHVKLTDAERRAWKSMAADSKLTVADLIRRRMSTKIEGREPQQKRPTRRADPRMIQSVGRVGSNLNQIARWANTYCEAVDAVQILAALVAIDEAISRFAASPSSYRLVSPVSVSVLDPLQERGDA